MPVARHNPYTFTSLAKEDFTNRYEKLHIDYSKFKHVGRPQYKKPYKHQDEIHTSCDFKYLQQRLVEVEEHLAYLTRLSQLQQERHLLEHLSTTSSPPLLHRLSSPPPPSYTPPEELPLEIKFRKMKITLREKEYWLLILATCKRLSQVEDFMKRREIPEKDRENVHKLLGSFKDLENTFWERSDKFINKNWRLIKRDLIAVKRYRLTVWIVDGEMYALS